MKGDLRNLDEKKLEVHYWELPKDVFVSLNKEFHDRLCRLAQIKANYNFKNCFHKILNCPKWHAQRLYNQEIRFTIKELTTLSNILHISPYKIEKNIEAIGNQEDGTIIKNPNFPFKLKDLFYVASHLFFDGSFRYKRGCYFYVYEDDLLEYHKKRLNNFGEVPMNLIKKENQLYFSYTIGFIVKCFLEIDNFKSTSCYLSEKFKYFAKKYKILTDEIIKAMIVDEGAVEDKIKIELANERLTKELYDIISEYYRLNKLAFRERNIYFKNNPEWDHKLKCWKIEFSSESFENLYNSLSPLPIGYKERAFKLLHRRKIRGWYKRKPGETKKMVIRSLLSKPKSIFELADELCIKNGTILSHIYGHPTYSTPLMELDLIKKVKIKELKRGGYTKVDIYGILNIKHAKEFIK